MKATLRLLHLELERLLVTPHGRRTFLAGLPFLLAACASAPRHRHREGDNTGQETTLTPEDEEKMAREYLPEMRKEYPTHKNPYVQSYIRDLGEHMVAANNLEGRPYNYSFEVVESEHINAFALPSGPVFVTAPLLRMTENEAELAGVVGHEVGHIEARHSAERIHKAQQEKNKSLIYGIGGAIVGGAAGFGLGRLLCSEDDRKCLARAAARGALAGGAGGLLIQKFAFMANSREDEMEADRIGFRRSVKAGHHPDFVGNFYTKLLEMEQKHRQKSDALSRAFVDAMSTHPPSKERVAQMTEMKNSTTLKRGKINSQAFKKVKALLA